MVPRFFCNVFFERILASILDGFFEARTFKNQQKPLFFQWFLLIFIKSTFAKKYRKILNFGFIFGGRNDKNLMNNAIRKIFFFNIKISAVFSGFFQNLFDFGRVWGFKKLKKIAKNRVQAAFGIHLKLKAISEAMFEGF